MVIFWERVGRSCSVTMPDCEKDNQKWSALLSTLNIVANLHLHAVIVSNYIIDVLEGLQDEDTFSSFYKQERDRYHQNAQIILDFLNLQGHGFILSDSVHLNGIMSCEKVNEISSEIQSHLQSVLSEADGYEEFRIVVELVESLIQTEDNAVDETNEMSLKNKSKRKRTTKKKKASSKQKKGKKRKSSNGKKKKVSRKVNSKKRNKKQKPEDPLTDQQNEETAKESDKTLLTDDDFAQNSAADKDIGAELPATIESTVENKTTECEGAVTGVADNRSEDGQYDEKQISEVLSQTDSSLNTSSQATSEIKSIDDQDFTKYQSEESSLKTEWLNTQSLEENLPEDQSMLIGSGTKSVFSSEKISGDETESSVERQVLEHSGASRKTFDKNENSESGVDSVLHQTGFDAAKSEVRSLYKKECLNFLLVLKPNLDPLTLAKINKMLQFFQELHPKVKINLVNAELKYTDEQIDLLIVCGGDGSLLFAASLFTKIVPPIIGFKAGNLNYLLHHDLDSFESVFESVFRGETLTVKQHRLIASVNNETAFGVNEVSVHRGASAQPISVEVNVNDSEMITIVGDGVIVASSTGSTAYCMAAGGSIVHPDVACLQIVPICSCNFFKHSVVLPYNAIIKLVVKCGTPNLTVDTRTVKQLEPGDSLEVTTDKNPLRFLHTDKSKPAEQWTKALQSKCRF